MTLREELYNVALRVNEEKKAREEYHYELAADHLKDVLSFAANSGKFRYTIIPTRLKDGSELTEYDIERFAAENNLDYVPSHAPYYPIISFDKK